MRITKEEIVEQKSYIKQQNEIYNFLVDYIVYDKPIKECCPKFCCNVDETLFWLLLQMNVKMIVYSGDLNRINNFNEILTEEQIVDKIIANKKLSKRMAEHRNAK